MINYIILCALEAESVVTITQVNQQKEKPEPPNIISGPPSALGGG
jgi:hypothetical protein